MGGSHEPGLDIAAAGNWATSTEPHLALRLGNLFEARGMQGYGFEIDEVQREGLHDHVADRLDGGPDIGRWWRKRCYPVVDVQRLVLAGCDLLEPASTMVEA